MVEVVEAKAIVAGPRAKNEAEALAKVQLSK